MNENELYPEPDVSPDDMEVQHRYDDPEPDEPTAFDNEFLKYIVQLSKNKSIGDIVDFIKQCRWSDRQKRTIMAYTKIVLGDGLSTSFIRGNQDYQSLYDDKNLVDCDLALGLTTFDITPEFNQLLVLVNLHFGLESRKSFGAFFVNRIGTQRHEYEHSEKQIITEKTGLREKMRRIL